MNLHYEVDQAQLNEAVEKLGNVKSGAPKAISRALNKTATSARKHLSDGIKQLYTAKVTGVKSAMKIKKATTGNLVAQIDASGSALKISLFHTGKSTKRKGAKVEIMRGHGLRPVGLNGNKSYKNGEIYARTTKARGPNLQFKGPSVPKMILNDSSGGAFKQVDPQIKSDLHRYMDAQIALLVGGDK